MPAARRRLTFSRLEHGAAPDGDDRTATRHRFRDRVAFARAERGLAVLGEDGRDPFAGALFDELVGVDEGAPEPLASRRPTSSFPSP